MNLKDNPLTNIRQDQPADDGNTSIEPQKPGKVTEASRDFQWDLCVGIVPLVACIPMLLFAFAALWSREHMKFFPLPLAAVAIFFFLWARKSIPATNRNRRWAAITCFLFGAALFAMSVWYFSPNFALLAACSFLFGWSLGRLGNIPWASIASVVCLATSIVIWPLNWDRGFSHWLENLAAWGTTCALDALSIACISNGGRIEIQGLTLVANEICGGAASVFAFISFTIFLSMITKRSMLTGIAAVLCVPIWTLLSNFLRLFTILLTKEYWGRDLSSGWDFRILEIATVLMVLGLIWLSTIFFRRLFDPIPVGDAEFGPIFSGLNKLLCWPQPDPFEEMEPEDEYERKQFLKMRKQKSEQTANVPQFAWESEPRIVWLLRGVSAITLIAGLIPITRLVGQGLEFGLPSISAERAASLVSSDALPVQIPDSEWKLQDTSTIARNPRSQFGRYSLTWQYGATGRQMLASVDFPFLGWHDVVSAQELQGWKAERETIDWGDAWPFAFAELENELGGKAYIFYSFLTRNAQPYVRTPALVAVNNSGELPADLSNQSSGQATYQFQVFIESGAELTRLEISEVQERFLYLRKIVRESIAESLRD